MSVSDATERRLALALSLYVAGTFATWLWQFRGLLPEILRLFGLG